MCSKCCTWPQGEQGERWRIDLALKQGNKEDAEEGTGMQQTCQSEKHLLQEKAQHHFLQTIGLGNRYKSRQKRLPHAQMMLLLVAE